MMLLDRGNGHYLLIPFQIQHEELAGWYYGLQASDFSII